MNGHEDACTHRDAPGADVGVPLCRPFPTGDWQQPMDRLEELYRWVEEGALATAAWYWQRRLAKRRAARALRCVAALCTMLAAALPMLALAGRLPSGAELWGYGALLAAAGCLAADRCFGLTAGWIHHVAAAQAIARALQSLQYEWARADIRTGLGPAGPALDEIAEHGLDLLHQCSREINEIVRAETAEWRTRCGAQPAAAYPSDAADAARRGAFGNERTRPPPQLPGRTGGLPGSGGGWPSNGREGRGEVPRMQMPRQRPPEGPAG